MKQSDLDPCLFVGDTVIAVMYVDDILMWSTDEAYIYHLGGFLRAEGIELEEDDDDAGFLGVQLTKCKSGQMIMNQEGLIDRIIEALGLDVDQSRYAQRNSMPEGSTHEGFGWRPMSWHI